MLYNFNRGDNLKLLSTIIEFKKNNKRISAKTNKKHNCNKNAKNIDLDNSNTDKKNMINILIRESIKKARKIYGYQMQKVILSILLISAILLVPATQINEQQTVYGYHEQYRLPLPSGLEHQPSYSIRIPFGVVQADSSLTYTPSQVAIPAGMTVVWFNDDSNPHTVTTISAAPEEFDSGIIPPGGFSVMTLTKPGLYVYYDKMNPSLQGSIIVGDLVQLGKNMEMRIGGNLPFKFTELGRLVLSFIPQGITLPPPLKMTYNVSIYDATMDNQIYNRQFTDIDGILDLEIVPITVIKDIPKQIKKADILNNNVSTFAMKKENSTELNISNQNVSNKNNKTDATGIPSLSTSTIKTTTYGPDISSPITGTFHIEGPILVEPNDYIIKVEIISIDGKSLSNSIEDVFILPAKI